jgi:hypothetical protein
VSELLRREKAFRHGKSPIAQTNPKRPEPNNLGTAVISSNASGYFIGCIIRRYLGRHIHKQGGNRDLVIRSA